MQLAPVCSTRVPSLKESPVCSRPGCPLPHQARDYMSYNKTQKQMYCGKCTCHSQAQQGNASNAGRATQLCQLITLVTLPPPSQVHPSYPSAIQRCTDRQTSCHNLQWGIGGCHDLIGTDRTHLRVRVSWYSQQSGGEKASSTRASPPWGCRGLRAFTMPKAPTNGSRGAAIREAISGPAGTKQSTQDGRSGHLKVKPSCLVDTRALAMLQSLCAVHMPVPIVSRRDSARCLGQRMYGNKLGGHLP